MNRSRSFAVLFDKLSRIEGQSRPKYKSAVPNWIVRRTLRVPNLIIRFGFHSTVLLSISFFLYTACFTHPSSSNLSCNLCLWYYDQLVLFNEEINANIYRHSLWEYSKRFHCSFEWHLTPHMMLSIETCFRRTPCIERTQRHSPRVSA